MGILGPLLGLVNFILGRSDRWQDSSIEQRTWVANYLLAVSDCLVRVAANLRAKQDSYFSCAELARYALGLPDSVQSALGEEGQKLFDSLQSAASDRMALYQNVVESGGGAAKVGAHGGGCRKAQGVSRHIDGDLNHRLFCGVDSG